MYTSTIIAFAVLLIYAEDPGAWRAVPQGDVVITLSAAIGLPVLYGLLSWWGATRAFRELSAASGTESPAVHARYLRWNSALRAAMPVTFAATVFLTRWPEWFRIAEFSPWLQVLGDLGVLLPFVAGLIAHWIGTFSFEGAVPMLETHVAGTPPSPIADEKAEPGPWRVVEVDSAGADEPDWTLWSFLVFHLRHDLLAAAAPLTLVLLAADVTRGYESELTRWIGADWGADLILGIAAAAIFLISPVLIVRIWRTRPLDRGPLRDRLEALCGRIGLRVRDILVWHSEGTIINAAVMGISARARYVLLSDALLESMTPRQTESVFGHEAGHVRHHHILAFLAFALIGWLTLSAVMEVFTLALGGVWSPETPTGVIAVAVSAVIAILWILGFGSLSRQFERQADVFGAVCATPPAEQCRVSCAVHNEGDREHSDDGRICMSGARIFASALDRVAVLNGIPHEERSWRHASIRRRIEALIALAGDPGAARRFDAVMVRIKWALVVGATIGPLLWLVYWLAYGEPAILSARLGG
ncbi:MAG: M48 family metalloprotease [Phycisphaerae bacterium]|nr:M48 family metalloprotease [Phycisphaerae bacterium]